MGSRNSRIQGRDNAILKASFRVGLPWSMSSLLRYTLPLISDSLSARRRRSTGAYVSGTVKDPRIQTTPAKAPKKPITHLHPAFIPKNPPQIGPSTGPKKGAEANRLIAIPRSLACRLLVPSIHFGRRCPEAYREHVGDDTTSVGQRRCTKSTSEEAKDNQSPDVLRTRATTVERSKRKVREEEDHLATKHLTEWGPEQRPYVLLAGGRIPSSRGEQYIPMAKPRTKSETPRVATSLPILNCSSISATPPV